MSRRLIVTAALVVAPTAAFADEPAVPAPTPAPAPAHFDERNPNATDPGEQGLGATLGIASGGHLTPGGLRLGGHYTYQLTDSDWFDGAAVFTIGAGGAACFTDRSRDYVCDHGLLDGRGIEAVAAVRHYFDAVGDRRNLRPFARAGLGVGLVRYGDDAVTGMSVVGHAGGGLRVEVSPVVAIVGEADFALGVGAFGHGIGAALEAGLSIVAGVEFRL